MTPGGWEERERGGRQGQGPGRGKRAEGQLSWRESGGMARMQEIGGAREEREPCLYRGKPRHDLIFLDIAWVVKDDV